jgi:hypothetical protein
MLLYVDHRWSVLIFYANQSNLRINGLSQGQDVEQPQSLLSNCDSPMFERLLVSLIVRFVWGTAKHAFVLVGQNKKVVTWRGMTAVSTRSTMQLMLTGLGRLKILLKELCKDVHVDNVDEETIKEMRTLVSKGKRRYQDEGTILRGISTNLVQVTIWIYRILVQKLSLWDTLHRVMNDYFEIQWTWWSRFCIQNTKTTFACTIYALNLVQTQQ